MMEQRLVLPVHLVGTHAMREQGAQRIRIYQISLTARMNRRHAKTGPEQTRKQLGTGGAHRECRADAVWIARVGCELCEEHLVLLDPLGVVDGKPSAVRLEER